jgi:CDP-diglyceride synthetase
MRAELRNRLLIGPLLAGTAFAALAWDFQSGMHLGLFALLAVALPFACGELRRLESTVAAGPVQRAPTLVISWLLLAGAWLEGVPAGQAWVTERLPWLTTQRLATLGSAQVLIALGLVWTVLVQMRRRAFEHFFSNVAYTLFGILYLGLSTSLMLRLAMMPGADGYVNRGNQLLLVAITVVKLGDVAAYFGGRALGRHKMAPRISPGKTWEGFACSFIGAIGGAYLMQAVFAQLCAHPPFATWWEPIVWGAVLGPIGAAGDLAESCMKREASVKDSGDTLPGFGGWLDVFDAILLSAPIAYVLGVVV